MNLTIFRSEQFGEIRTVLIDNEPWFVAKDVALALGYTNPQKAIRDHCDGVTNRSPILDSLDRQQDAVVISEKGLYRLIMRSNLPDAVRFQDWICDEVLPSLRKHGGYLVQQETMTPEQLLANALIYANKVIEEKAKQLESMKEENRELTCAYEYQKSQNKLLTHINKTYCATEIAKELGMKSANELNTWLREKGVQYYMNKTWVPYSKYATLGYFDIKQEVLDSGKVIYHRKITQTGREFILTLFDKEENND